jgi:peroxidase
MFLMPVLDAPTPLLRLTDVRYGDGVGSFSLGVDPVKIAQLIFDQDGDMPDPGGLSALMVSWGQVIDHDLSLTRDASGELVFVPGLIGPFQRSVYDGGTGSGDPRQPLNEITPQMDASMVYGSTPERLTDLRSYAGGRMRTSADPASDERGLLPLAEDEDEMAGSHAATGPLFLAGDIRANENIGLTTLQTLFMREHNYWAGRLAKLHPDWTDEQLFTTARSIVEVEIQTITYESWLPALLVGNEALAPVAAVLAPSTGFDPTVNGQVSVEFSTAAFRVGHTMVSSEVPLLDEAGEPTTDTPLSVMDAFFNSAPLRSGAFDDILRSQAGMYAQAIDTKIIDDLNFFLTSGDGVTGFSLAALNILRGRDHGLESYINTRAALLGDLDPASIAPDDFGVISSDPAIQAALADIYANVHEVDLWVGGLAEDRAAGAQLGPVFAWIVADQFQRTRTADDSFGKLADTLDSALVEEIANTGLRDLILRNTDITHLQADPFYHADRVMGQETNDLIWGSDKADLIMGMGGQDMLMGGDGRDALFGGDGADHLRGGMAADELQGQDGNDTLSGWKGDDVLLGGAGHDQLFGSFGQDAMDGGTGNDTLRGGMGSDTLNGGEGDDLLTGWKGDDQLAGGDGDDQLLGGAGRDTLDGGNGNDELRGGAGPDRLNGGTGSDQLYGGYGADTLDGGAGNDFLHGGVGSDIFIFFDGFGMDIIAGFEAANPFEQVDLSGVSAITDWMDLQANHLTQSGADTIISDGFGNSVTLLNIELSAVDASDFLF